MVAAVEGIESQWVRGPRGPEPEGVHVAPAPAHHWCVVGDRHDGFTGAPDIPERSVRCADRVDRPAEMNVEGGFRAFEFPGIPEGEPILWIFLLLAVFDD